MRKLISLVSFVGLCFGLAGCGDGTLEVKTKTAPSNPTVIVEKPAPAPTVVIEKPADTTTRETKTESRSIDGVGTVKTKETKTTNP